MEVEYAIVLYVQLTPDILVPNEWPLSGIHNIFRKLAKEIIMQNDHEDPILQVDGMPARIGRYVGKQGFYYVFNKVSKEEIYGCYVYDIILRGDVNNNQPLGSSGTAFCTGPCMSDDCSCSMNYVVMRYQAPTRSRMYQIPEDCVLEMD